MHIPKPFPDEFISGHFSRIQSLHHTRKFSDIIRFLGSDHHKQASSHRYSHEVVARASGMSVERYRHEHTTLNLRTLRAPRLAGTVGDTKCRVFDAALLSNNSRSRTHTWKLCQKCQQQDMDRFNCAYWHRSHQIGGMDICVKHQEPLMRFDEKAIWQHPNPNSIVGPVAVDKVLDAATHPVVRRYLGTVTILQNSKLPDGISDRIGCALLTLSMGSELHFGYSAEYWSSEEFAAVAPAAWVSEHIDVELDELNEFAKVNEEGHWLGYKKSAQADGIRSMRSLLGLCALSSSRSELLAALMFDTVSSDIGQVVAQRSADKLRLAARPRGESQEDHEIKNLRRQLSRWHS